MEANYAQGDYFLFLDGAMGEIEHIRVCRFRVPLTGYQDGTTLDKKLMLMFGETKSPEGIDVELLPPGSTPDTAKDVCVKINEQARERIATQGSYGRKYDGQNNIVITNGLPRRTVFDR
jgi:hypothetical protein